MSVIQLSKELAAAMLDMDIRLFRAKQTMEHANAMIEPLAWMGMDSCAKAAHRIYADMRLRYVTGDVLHGVRTRIEVDHPAVLDNPAEVEVLRQFGKVAVIFYELTREEEAGAYGQKIMEDHAQFITAAVAVVGKED
jgi:hypothetical protein